VYAADCPHARPSKTAADALTARDLHRKVDIAVFTDCHRRVAGHRSQANAAPKWVAGNVLLVGFAGRGGEHPFGFGIADAVAFHGEVPLSEGGGGGLRQSSFGFGVSWHSYIKYRTVPGHVNPRYPQSPLRGGENVDNALGCVCFVAGRCRYRGRSLRRRKGAF